MMYNIQTPHLPKHTMLSALGFLGQIMKASHQARDRTRCMVFFLISPTRMSGIKTW